MKNLTAFLIVSLVAFPTVAGNKKAVQDSHNSIYTPKIKRIVNAVNIGEFSTEEKYFEMLQTACGRNKCSNLEKQTIKSVGQQIVSCQIKHLKSHGIENPDAKNICESQNAQLGCDSISTSLLRKMCYTGNQYSLKVWRDKESKIKARSRVPASSNSK